MICYICAHIAQCSFNYQRNLELSHASDRACTVNKMQVKMPSVTSVQGAYLSLGKISCLCHRRSLIALFKVMQLLSELGGFLTRSICPISEERALNLRSCAPLCRFCFVCFMTFLQNIQVYLSLHGTFQKDGGPLSRILQAECSRPSDSSTECVPGCDLAERIAGIDNSLA